MIVFKDVHEMRRWVVEKLGTGWSPGSNGYEVAEIIDEMQNRPPYQTDWTLFLNSLPPDMEELVQEKRHLAKPKKEFIALVQMPDKKNQVLGVIFERDKNDCYREVYKIFPQLVQYESKVVIKTKSELTAGEKKQLQNLK